MGQLPVMNQSCGCIISWTKSLVICNKCHILFDGLCFWSFESFPFRSSNRHCFAPNFFILSFLFKPLIHSACTFCVGYYEGIWFSFHWLVNCYSDLQPFPFALWSHVYCTLTFYKGLSLASLPSSLLHMSVPEYQSVCPFALAVYLNL